MASRIPNVKATSLGPRRMPQVLMGLAVGVLLASVITACVSNDSAIGRVVMAMNEETSHLPETTRQQLDRFKEVYDTYVEDASDRERLDYFNFAYRRVRANYVYEVDDTKLINEAIAGVKEQKAKPGTMAPEKVVEDALHRIGDRVDPLTGAVGIEAPVAGGVSPLLRAVVETAKKRKQKK